MSQGDRAWKGKTSHKPRTRARSGTVAGIAIVLVVFGGIGVESTAVAKEQEAPAIERASMNGIIDIREFGASGDGKTADGAAFRQALTRIGGEPATLAVSRGIYAVDALEFPENVTLLFRPGGMLQVAAGERIEIHGTIEAGTAPIFAGEGSVGGPIANLHVYPQWFGARGDGVQDDSRALQQAADLAAEAMGRTLYIPDGEYLFQRDVIFRCNIESRGLLVKEMEIDEARTQFSHDLFLPTHFPKTNPHIYFQSDHPDVALDPEAFLGIEEGDLALPAYRGLPLANGSGSIDLQEGGTLRFYSSDFFTSRNVRKGDHYYDKNDITQIVSGRGSVFPEFAFSYHHPPEAEEWRADAVYKKGEYVSRHGRVFKATWPSGDGSVFEHRHLGRVEIGPVPPREDADTTVHRFTYSDGTADSISLWRRVETGVWYRKKDVPLTVNGLRVEVRLRDPGGETRRIAAGAMNVERSNMTFNNLEITVRDREATMSRLLTSRHCVNVEFNNGYFSGATSHHLGYNILNSNVANFRYNHCISTNSRKGMDGRHGKNITIQGGHYNVIEDHYGRNFLIRDVVVTGLTTQVPGDSTPNADLQSWHFRTIRPFGFSGAHLRIENVTVEGGGAGILSGRSDVGDLYGNVVLRDIFVRRNTGDVALFTHAIHSGFDYAREVGTPSRVILENVSLENPGRFSFDVGNGFPDGAYGPIFVRNVGPIGNVRSSSAAMNFKDCTFEDARFSLSANALVNIQNCTFGGQNTGLTGEMIGRAAGNAKKKGATLSFPLEHLNPVIYETPDTATAGE